MLSLKRHYRIRIFMIREWAIVISWRQGIAQLRYKQCFGYNSCCINYICSSNLHKKTWDSLKCPLYIISQTPLVRGQLVEIGISESGLLYLTFLVYMVPLLGLIIGAMVLHNVFGTDLSSACGSLIGSIFSLLLTYYLITRYLRKRDKNKPIILQVMLKSSL